MRLKVEALEQTTANQILLLLHQNGPLKLSEITLKLEKPVATIYRAVPKLKELGLINDKVTPYPVKRIFSLTERGRRVAEKLAEIEGILGER